MPKKRQDDQTPVKRVVIQNMPYADWCKAERLPRDECSRAVYRHWKKSLPRLQKIIDDIAGGYLCRAHDNLGRFLTAFDGRHKPY